MKQILIIGQNSYIGRSLSDFLTKFASESQNSDEFPSLTEHRDKIQSYNNSYKVTTLSVRSDEWKFHNFTIYDSIVYLAALVHKKETSAMEADYYHINCDLPFEVARKAKDSGVSQFIFLSTMAVFGLEGKIGQTVVIDKNTRCEPITYYGKSKLKAEKQLSSLILDSQTTFRIAVLRPPMVYGPDCPGNFAKLKKLVLKYKVFPDIQNQRSMIYIGNLCHFIKDLIDQDSDGVFHPQNEEYMSTLEMVKKIAVQEKVNLKTSKLLGSIVRIIGPRLNAANKAFGSLVYDKEYK